MTFSSLHPSVNQYPKKHCGATNTLLSFGLCLKSCSSNPRNAGKNALFNCLADFKEAAMEEDKSFIIFPFHLMNIDQ